MNIDFLDTTTKSAEGIEWEIRNPKTGARTHLYFTILGPDCKAYNEVVRDVMKKLDPKWTPDDVTKEVVIRTTKGFRAEELDGVDPNSGNEVWKDTDVIFKGQALKFSEQTMRDLVAVMPTIWSQLAAVQKERGHFLLGPATV